MITVFGPFRQVSGVSVQRTEALECGGLNAECRRKEHTKKRTVECRMPNRRMSKGGYKSEP